jgi:hypothetical protein
MIPVRRSPAKSPNRGLRRLPPNARERNSAWIARTEMRDGVLLLGGSSLAAFRTRVAQSHLRHDLAPSYWSLAGLLEGGRRVWTVPMDAFGDTSGVPATNGVQPRPLTAYDDPEAFPNIAILDFGAASRRVAEAATEISYQRATVDLVSMIVPWLGFLWGTSSASNPLLQSVGLPSAAFVEAVYGMLRLELTPNLSTQSSCPEAIWQSAKWWHTFYEETASSVARGARRSDAPTAPHGYYIARQPEAAAVEIRRLFRRPPRR